MGSLPVVLEYAIDAEIVFSEPLQSRPNYLIFSDSVGLRVAI
jgi:hypothetical protein